MKMFLLISIFSIFCCNNSSTENLIKDYENIHQEAKKFCKKNEYNQSYYFLIDMSIPSGSNRFFVYDFESNSISDQNLVTHGSCDQFEENPNKWTKAKFSNQTNSHCSMKGKYKIGKRDYSDWGIHVKYWLDGLEKSNSNAKKRIVVLHSWSAVSDVEISPKVSPLSWGCPAVSDNFMKKLDIKLQKTQKPVLLWIIE